ncbi:efflux RND transporter periplasmic adaptor subunit [Glaciimonas sp. Gout2]|uniref:efflux RND transporter periplasmic adaptor subunit n=2 Tax=Pseudomonadota TaxID=1224 RepID=UPI002B23422F|nr:MULTISPECIES: efflux RND transporter periplasmic adaptor subunit [unclassified Glaciimonas]MEB0012047.1 efflux RND transporter periplasmic adaptor subunit [Glaciimonas sp. Cout2]MEB0084292.1 efflux RND transporter periplasmic adaptor subunit [Glaciimonas sp. Gout2]
MKKKIIYASVASTLFLIAGLTYVIYSSRSPANAADAETPISAQVVTQPLKQGMLTSMLSAYGDVTPEHTVAVSSAYPVQITKLFVVQGQSVSKGTPLAVVQSDPSAVLSYQQAQSANILAQAELKRTKELLGLQMATQSQLDTAQKNWQDTQATLMAQQKLGGGNPSNTLLAPSSGVVLTLTAAQGDRLAAGASMMQFGNTDSLKVLLGIDPSHRATIHKGSRVTLAPLSNPAQTEQASVSEIQNLLDPKTQLINVVVTLSDTAAKRFIPGMRVHAEIATGQQQVYEVPRQAVLSDDQGSYLFQVKQGKAVRVEVRNLIDNGATLGVSGNLDPAAPLVVLGNYELKNQMLVRETKP